MRTRIGAAGALLGVLCVVWNGSAFADPATPTANTPLSPKEHEPVNCETLLPPGHTPDTLRTTWLSVHILPSGEIRDATVVQSSGRFDLDDAAVACANDSHSLPATIDGAPAEIVWGAEVEWHPTGHVYAIPGKAPGYSSPCLNAYPVVARRSNETGSALITFLIEPDGSVRQPEITKSSGFKDLDDAALECVSGWRFAPATANGKPVEFGWQAGMTWTLSP